MKKLLFIAAAAITMSCGNKQQAQQSESDSIAVATDSVVAKVSAPNDADIIEAKTPEMIKEFYKKYVFDNMKEREEVTDDVIKKYCTKKLAKKLADDYEYEGGGYAIWDFRSGAQDGDSDVQEITKVESLGGGKFKVHYNDMGNKGAHILTVVLEDGNVRFDEISE